MAVAVAAPERDRDPVRSGPRHWLRSYLAMLRWEAASLRMWLPLVMVIQILGGAGFVLGIALFFDRIPDSAALFVSTGVPVILLLMVGLMLGPQVVADQRAAGTDEFLLAMPVPRTVAAAAWYTVTLVAGIPSVVIALWLAHLRYGISFALSPAIVPAVLLVTFTGTMLGYAVGHAMPSPMATRLLTQLLVFVVFGFAPILFPLRQMPAWLGAANWWFPFRHMAVIVRAALRPELAAQVGVSYLVVAAWGVACAVIAAWAIGRRP
jgi:ABC-2 type transport system permease protein